MISRIDARHTDLNSLPGRLTKGSSKSLLYRLRSGVSLRVLLLSVAAGGCLPVDAEAKKLKHGPTGFSATAPSGFRLKASNGIYSIKKGRDSATVMKVSSPLDAKGVARSFISGARMKQSRVSGGGARVVVTGNIGSKATYVEVLGSGPVFTVKKYVTTLRGKKSKQARALSPLTLGDIALLRRIGNSARGGIVSPFQIDIPMQRFTQGGATALVPNIPGWSYSGVGGAIDGSRPGQGFFSLGIYFPSQASSFDPGQTIVNDWPRISGNTILGIQIIPGTGGILGSPFNSATYMVRMSSAGVSYDAIMTSGVVSNPNGFGIDWYFSVIAVRTGAFPGLGNTLSQTWATWDASANRASRIASTIATIRSTPTVAIDRDVFDRIQSAWVSFIRQ